MIKSSFKYGSICVCALALIQIFIFPFDNYSDDLSLFELGLLIMAVLLASAFQIISHVDRPNYSSIGLADLISGAMIICLLAITVGRMLDYRFQAMTKKALANYKGQEVILSSNGWAQLNGSIGHSTLLSLIEINEKSSIEYLKLNSTGGLIDTALAIGNYIEEERISTVVSDECASACVLIALNGDTLFVKPTASFGFHNASSIASEGSERGRLSSQYGSELLFSELENRGIPNAIIEKATETPASDMYYVNGQRLVTLGLAESY